MFSGWEVRVYWQGKTTKRLIKRFRYTECPTDDEIMDIVFEYEADEIDIERF